MKSPSSYSSLTSKAWVLEKLGYDGLSLRTRNVQSVGPGQVLVRMRAATLNFRDLKIMKGVYGAMNPNCRSCRCLMAQAKS